MTIARLMTRPVTIVRMAESVSETDVYGNPTVGTAATATALAYLEQVAEDEEQVDRATFRRTWLVVLPAGTPLDASDHIVADGLPRLEVIGPPRRPWRPSTGEHHVEATCVATAG